MSPAPDLIPTSSNLPSAHTSYGRKSDSCLTPAIKGERRLRSARNRRTWPKPSLPCPAAAERVAPYAGGRRRAPRRPYAIRRVYVSFLRTTCIASSVERCSVQRYPSSDRLMPANRFSPVLVLRSIFRSLQGGMDAVRHEVKCCPAFHLDALSRMMSQHERRHVIRRFLAPPPFP